MGIIATAVRSTGGSFPNLSYCPAPDGWLGAAPAVETMPAFETIEVDTTVVACDGDTHGPGGHPKVYLNLSANGKVECPYCSRLYVRRGMPGALDPKVAGPHL
jgi:uncharacterized Zn-finger protein